MCLECGPLIKAIDAYIEKADEDLEKQLGAEGYAEPKRTLEYAQDIEDGVADALNEENDEIVSAAEKAEDLSAFAQDVWPGMKESDAVDEKLSSVFKRNFEKFMPEFVDYYIQQTDRKLKLEQVSKRTTAWVGSWSEELGKLMKLNSHLEIEAILQKGLQDGKGVAEFTRQILDSGIRDTYYKARRVAVTEVLRAHSVAQQESFMQSPSVSEKMWKHTGSYRNQPRQNHVDMDGQRVAKDAMFTLIGIKGGILQCMYPRDPSLPPEESINCHCICQPVVDEGILGMSLEERQKLQQQAINEMDDEWEKELDARNRAKAGIEPGTIAAQPKKPKTFADKIQSVKDKIAASGGTVTEQHLMEAGGYVEDDLKVNRQPLREKYEKAKTVWEAADAETLKRNDELVALWDKYDSATTAEERMALKPSLDRAAEAADDARNKSLNAFIDEKDAYFKYRGSGAENAKELKEKLAEIREMGVVGHDLKKEHFIGRGSMRSVVEEAYNHYPREWVDKSVDEGGLRVKKTRRGYYAHSAKEIAISGNGFSTATHELGHRFERVVDGIREAEQEFYDRRTAGEALEWLGKPYEKNETTRKDKFLDPYMGKDYGGSAYELVSMGFEMAFNDPVSLWDDEEYAKWIYGILSLM